MALTRRLVYTEKEILRMHESSSGVSDIGVFVIHIVTLFPCHVRILTTLSRGTQLLS
jgi:hypothetical protein